MNPRTVAGLTLVLLGLWLGFVGFRHQAAPWWGELTR